MNKILMICVAILTLSSCMEKNFFDTGKASGIFDGNMMEYLRAHEQNWDLTVEVIEYAGLTDIFEGKNAEYKEITFFGPTNLSILRYMENNDIENVSDRSKDEWKEMMLKHVIKGKYMKEDFSKGDEEKGGDEFTPLGGNSIRVFKFIEEYGGEPEAGETNLYIKFKGYSSYKIASADIEPNNGTVHSLPYAYTFGKI